MTARGPPAYFPSPILMLYWTVQRTVPYRNSVQYTVHAKWGRSSTGTVHRVPKLLSAPSCAVQYGRTESRSIVQSSTQIITAYSVFLITSTIKRYDHVEVLVLYSNYLNRLKFLGMVSRLTSINAECAANKARKSKVRTKKYQIVEEKIPIVLQV